jgi:hypothetical protein
MTRRTVLLLLVVVVLAALYAVLHGAVSDPGAARLASASESPATKRGSTAAIPSSALDLLGVREGELCGYGRFVPGEGHLLPAEVEQGARVLLARLRERVLREGGPRQQAQVQAVLGAREVSELAEACGGSASCMAGVEAAWAALAQDLAERATRSRAPELMVLALKACGPSTGAPACAGVTPAAWAERDPDNARAWLAMLRTPGLDDAQRAAIVARAAAAKTADPRLDGLLALVTEPEVSGASMPVRLAALMPVLGMAAAMPLRGQSEAEIYCKAPVRTPQERADCTRLADLLIDRGRTMSEHLLGRRLGRGLGWSEARLEGLTLESHRLSRVLAPPAIESFFDFFNCAQVEHLDGRIGYTLGEGELAWARRQLRAAPPAEPLTLPNPFGVSSRAVAR